MRLIFLGLIFVFGVSSVALAGTYKDKIDSTYVPHVFGEPIKIAGKQRYAFVIYTKIFEKDGKLTICGARYGIIDDRFTGRAAVKVGGKRLLSNVNYFQNITNAKKFSQSRKKAKSKQDVLQSYTRTDTVSDVEGLTSSCRQTRQKWKPEYGAQKPEVVIPSRIVVYTRS